MRLGATWHGYQTLWVNRNGQPFEELGTQPTRIGNEPARQVQVSAFSCFL